jgi:EpsI family protein
VLILASSSVLADRMKPHEMMSKSFASFDVASRIPKSFGRWTEEPRASHVGANESDELAKEIYNQQVIRGYRDPQGRLVTLLVAYGANQSEKLQLHRPETCYVAAGFRITDTFNVNLKPTENSTPFPAHRLVAKRDSLSEPLTYWMRFGYDVSESLFERQALKLEYGLRGMIPDGVLVRVSTDNIGPRESFGLHDEFISDLMKAVDDETRTFLTGQPSKAFLLHGNS